MNLYKIRKELGISQVTMASEIGVSVNTYIMWERKVMNPNEENQIKLEEAIARMQQKEA